MRRMSIVLAATLMAGGVGASVATAAEAAPVSRPQARDDKPPFPYADCFRVAKKRGETPAHAKWHCDELVKKGWVKPPLPKRPQSEPAQAGHPKTGHRSDHKTDRKAGHKTDRKADHKAGHQADHKAEHPKD
ncbi:hypothetical protein [Streptomyces eurocidicus]|uniref:Uncharacterized protein n=1 Tax=Streptomyces eurocidicus TaxID=66423 RepID=A0A7W8F4K6_STREU|nr:hypothetical protein [Streptomyces eurocidicus]MBB5122973.1 hypothetical protein [Streptomyces eurocidicus]